MKRVVGAVAVSSVLFLCSPFSVAQEEAVPGDTSPVLAIVSGEVITQNELLAYVEQSAGLSPAEVQAQLEETPDYLAQALGVYIDQILMYDAARAAKVDQSGLFRDRVDQASFDILLRTFVDQEVAGTVTDDVLQSAYGQFRDQYQPETEIRAQHILVDAEAEANRIHGLIRGGGDFDALASEFSSDRPTADSGGDLGFFAPGDVDEKFFQAVSGLENGQLSDPVLTDFGWHIIRRIESRLQEVPGLDVVRDDLRNVIIRQRLSQLIETLRDEAKVQFVQSQ